MRKLFFLLVSTAITFNSFSQSVDRTLLTVADEKVSVDDFLSIYNKNRQVGEELDPKTLDEYLQLFINFKLKVKEAESLGMDTVPSFVKELSGYRKQLANPYLVDNEAGEKLVEEAYERLKTEIRASHILISVAEDASPSDTLKAYKRAQSIRQEILDGANFADIARVNSDDPSAKENSGDLGYFSALYMVYPFETAAYATAKGEVSEIIRSRYGYHFLNVTDKRPSRGEVKTAHIMVKYPSPVGKSSNKEKAIAKQKIDDIYNKIINESADFAEMAKQYSDDKNNSSKGGVLPWFGSNKMVAAYEDAAFSLNNFGDISVPIETPYGWHIIKLIDRKGLGSFEDEKLDIQSKVEKDSRSQAKRTSLVNKLKNEYNYKLNTSALNAMKEIVNNDFIAKNGKWSLKDNASSLTEYIFSLDSLKYNQYDFAEYLLSTFRRMKNKFEPSIFVDEAFTKWSEDLIIAYENSNLELKYNDFRLLMQEYRDGILLYELTDEKIWSKAVKDTIGLNAYYLANKKNYMWDTRVDATVINCLNESIALKVRKKIMRGNTNIDEIQTKINKKSSLNMDIDKGLYLRGENTFVDQVQWEQGLSDLIYDNQNVKMVYINEVLPPIEKELTQAKGLITSDYQDFLEKEWLSELKAKYSISVNSFVFNLLKTNRLSELNIKHDDKVSSFNGSFNEAFKKALNSLGSSKDIFFEWHGNTYTTELK